MATINIAGLTPVDDPSYRYKMPKILAKVEGRGNGIKTVLVNIIEVAESLNREAPEITKFFGCELGSQTTYAADTDRAVVNGAHTPQVLQTHLSRYIENFVLCAQCKLPETHYKIKNGIISQKCLACGFKGPVDMTHKLTTFILGQYKKAKESTVAGNKSSDKKEKKKDKKDVKEDTADSPTPSSAATTTTTTNPVKEKKIKKDKKSKPGSPGPEGDSANEDPTEAELKEGEDQGTTSEEVDNESDKAAVDASITRFNSWYAVNWNKNQDAILEELRMVQTFASLHVRYRPLILLGALCTDALITGKELSKYKDLISAVSGNTAGTQRHLIAAVEWFCGSRYPQLLKLFPVVLKQLFDLELVEEDVFLAWSNDIARNEYSADSSLISLETLEELRNVAGPFMVWLQEAEEEDDDGEENDED